MRPRGSMLGNIADPAQGGAVGVWSPIEMLEWRHKNKWPIAGVGDALDPNNKGSGITLSNNNRTASNSDYSWGNVRALTGRSSGKWYFEVEAVSQESSGYLMPGVDKSTGDLNTYHGANIGGYGYQSNGQYWNNNSVGGSHANFPPPPSVIVGVACDLDAGEIRFYKNNVLQGGTYTYNGLSGTFYPTLSMYGAGAEMIISLQSAMFVYSPPASYSAWVAG